jgi:hypothetical protein
VAIPDKKAGCRSRGHNSKCADQYLLAIVGDKEEEEGDDSNCAGCSPIMVIKEVN